MPNGFHGPKEEWEKITKPLRDMESVFTAFAKAHGLTITRNYHNWPSYHLKWSDGGVEKSIQFTGDEQGKRVSVGIVAWNDKQGMRFLKNHILRKKATVDSVKNELDLLLQKAHSIASSWSEKDLT